MPATTPAVPALKFNLATRLTRSTAVLLALLAAAVVLSAGVGAVSVPPEQVVKVIAEHIPVLKDSLNFHVSEADIVWEFHIPRVLLAALVGISLAMAGAALQGLLLNPLADPYMIGVSSGAAVGAGIAVMLGFAAMLVPLFAFLSAIIAVSIVYLLARRGEQVSALSFILAGVAVGAFMWAALTFILSVSPNPTLEKIVFWTMGSLAGSDPWVRVTMLAPFALVGFVALYAFARDLNILALGEESARHLGLDVDRLKGILIVLTTMVTAAAVSVSGTIGFVGLMVPHMTRRLVGPDNRVLLPCSALIGALLMIAADAVARTAMAPAEIPLGIITALLGAPFFLYLLRKTH